MSEDWRESFFDAVAAIRARGGFEPLVVLVGSNRLGENLRGELHRRFGGWLGVYTLTFIDLATRLVAARGPVRPLAPPEFLNALAARLVSEMPAGAFDRVREFAGTPGAFLGVFDDLVEADWPALPLAGGDPAKLRELDALYRRFRVSALEAGFDLPGARIAAAAEFAGEYERAFGTRRLSVVGFYDVNPTQARLVRALENAAQVKYHIPPVIEPSAFAVRVAGHVRGVEPKSKPFAARPGDRAWSCPDRHVEIREIAREIHSKIDAGVAPRTIAVVMRHPDTYRDLVTRHFAEFGVPIRLGGGRRPDEFASVRLCAALMRLAVDTDDGGRPRWRRAETAEFLAAAFADRAPGAGRWDSLSKRACVRRARDWDGRLAAIAAGDLAKDDFNAIDRTDARDLRAAWTTLRDAVGVVRGATSHAAAVDALMEAVGELLPTDAMTPDFAVALGPLRFADEAGLRFDADRYLTRAQNALTGISTREGVNERGGVQVLDMSAARGTHFEHVFVPGCVEGEIPHVGREDPILLDADRVALNRRVDADVRLPVFAERVRNERHLFDLACRSAGTSLTMTWPRREAGTGRTIAPSPFLVAMFAESMSLDEFEHANGVVKLMPVFGGEVAAPRTTTEHDVAAARALESERPGLSTLYLRDVSPGFDLRRRRQSARYETADFTGYDGLCATPDVQDALRDMRSRKPSMRVTEIEDYVQCPRRHLLFRIIGLASEGDPDDALTLDERASGELIHKALAVAGAGGDVEAAQSCLRAEYEKLAAAGRAAVGALAEIELEVLVRRMRALWDAGAAWSADATRVRTEQTLDDAESGESFLRGRIDRIEDLANGGVRVIDFKTGRASNRVLGGALEDDDLNAGQTLQLPIYARALVASDPTLRGRVECEYRYLKDKNGDESPTRVRMSSQVLAERMDAIDAVIAGVRGGIASGVFVPRADVAAVESPMCARCDARRICDRVARARAARLGGQKTPHPWMTSLVVESDGAGEEESGDA